MATMLRRPPARFVVHDRPEASGRVSGKTSGAMVDSPRSIGGSIMGTPSLDPADETFAYHVLDFVQINPAHEQPRLIYNSGAQPIIRWGRRRYVRTKMRASARFLGRWFYVGYIQNQFVHRARMSGAPMRGTTYEVPRFQVGPRAIILGSRRKGQ